MATRPLLGAAVEVDVATMPTGTAIAVDIASLPASNLGQQPMAASLSVVPANNITDATYIGDINFGESLPAGVNNIGDVDVASLPAANLGQQTMAASVSVVPASNVTDPTYIGDVNFGEALPAGEAHLGQVGGEGDSLSQTPTVTAGAYVANDAVGGLLEFTNAARVSGGGGVIKDVLILDDAGQDAELELWLFNATFTAMVDNAPWAPSEADLRLLVAIVSTEDGAWFAAGTPSAARVEVSQRYDLAGTSMFGQLVTRGTPSFVATDDVTVIVGLLQD